MQRTDTTEDRARASEVRLTEDRARASEVRLRQLFVDGLAGDAVAYHAFLKDLSAHLRAFLRRRLSRAPDDVEDLVQESLLAVHNQRHTYDPGQPLTAWVHAAAMVAVARTVRPGATGGRLPWGFVLPVAVMWLLGAIALFGAVPPARMELLFGGTWRSCPFGIALLSIPVFGAVLWAMTGLAPTRLALAGGAAGLLAGAIGALIYALHCTEMAAPFIGAWYVAGILLPAAAGAVLGPRLLRW